MSFVLGTSRLTYDFFGTWTRRIDNAAEAPVGVIGDPSWPGYTQPGTFMLCDEVRIVTVEATTTPEA